MKTILFILLLTIASSLFVKGQYSYEYQSTTVYTPTGIEVDANRFKYETYDDFTAPEIADENYDWTTGYNCQIEENSTKYYNCHGYAWHNIEGNMSLSDLRWIDNIDGSSNPTFNVNKYYSATYSSGNPSYKEVSTNNRANLKVSYFPRDHSAVTTSSTSYFISKWAWGPLVKHAPAQCPFYANATIKYYELNDATISSSSDGALCNNIQRTFTTNFTDPNFTYNWNCTNPLEEVSGDGTSSYTVKGTSQNDRGTLSLTVTTPSGASTSATNRYVWVGGPDIDNITVYYSSDITGSYPDEFCPGDVNELLARTNPISLNMELTSIYWDMGSWDVYDYDDAGYVLFEIPLSFSDYADVYYEVSNGCDVAITSETLYEGYCGGYYMIMAPNPASGETRLTIGSNDGPDSFDETAEWELEVYDNAQNLKEKKTNLKGNNAKLQTAGWKEGIYVVRVKYKDEILTGKLVVKK